MNLVSILISLQSVFQTIRILKAPTIVTNATTILNTKSTTTILNTKSTTTVLNGGSTVVTMSTIEPSSSILPTAATDSIVLEIVVPVLFFIVLILVVVAVVVFYLRYVINNMHLMQIMLSSHHITAFVLLEQEVYCSQKQTSLMKVLN